MSTTLRVAVASAAVTIGALAVPAVASAHTPTVSDDCTGLAVALVRYEGDSPNNRVTVTIDGTTTTSDFGSSFSNTYAWTQTAPHTWTVTVDANRATGNTAQWDRTFSGTQQPCQEPTTTTTTPPTTTEPPTTTTTPPTTEPPTVDTTLPPTTEPPTTPPTTTEPTVAVADPPIPPTTTTTIAPETQSLPATGPGHVAQTLGLAAAAVVLGAVAVRGARRPVR